MLLKGCDFMEYIFYLTEFGVFVIIQIFLSKRSKPLESIIIPLIYLLLNLKQILLAFSLKVQLIPDYYLIATLVFPCIELIFVYFIFFYYRLHKKQTTEK